MNSKPGAEAWVLGDGRLHLQHGPIDLVIEVSGDEHGRQRAFTHASQAFETVLETLVAELPLLRACMPYACRTTSASAVSASSGLSGPVAQRMMAAVIPHAGGFVSPMICVAGAVADHVLAAIVSCAHYSRASVNNGGDIALHLGRGECCRIGLCSDVASPVVDGHIDLSADDEVGGIATSGWRGRSHSLGVADAVTVVASSAAAADVAATLIANAVDVPDLPGIQRVAAHNLDSDSDLLSLPVTVAVDALNRDECEQALVAGVAFAECLHKRGLIRGACLRLQGQVANVGTAGELSFNARCSAPLTLHEQQAVA